MSIRASMLRLRKALVMAADTSARPPVLIYPASSLVRKRTFMRSDFAGLDQAIHHGLRDQADSGLGSPKALRVKLGFFARDEPIGYAYTAIHDDIPQTHIFPNFNPGKNDRAINLASGLAPHA